MTPTEIILSNRVIWSKYAVTEKVTQDILDEIFICLQPTIRRMLYDNIRSLPFPKDEENYFKVSIPFSTLKKITHDYDRLKKSAHEIARMTIEFAEVRENGVDKKNRRRYIYSKTIKSFCTKIRYELSNTEIQPGTVLNTAMQLCFFFTHAQLVDLINVAYDDKKQHYIDYTKYTKKKTTNKYAQKLNMLVSSMEKGETRTRSFEEWREITGATGATGDKYKKYSDFKRFVLEPAQKDLQDTDAAFTFNYVSNYITITRRKAI